MEHRISSLWEGGKGGWEGEPNLGDALKALGELQAADELVHAQLVLVLGLANAEDSLRGSGGGEGERKYEK